MKLLCSFEGSVGPRLRRAGLFRWRKKYRSIDCAESQSLGRLRMAIPLWSHLLNPIRAALALRRMSRQIETAGVLHCLRHRLVRDRLDDEAVPLTVSASPSPLGRFAASRSPWLDV